MITLIGNLKGGTGKSTVAFNLALWIATRQNKQVSVFDLDPQATTRDAFEIRGEEGYLPAITPNIDVDKVTNEPSTTEVIVDVGMTDLEAVYKVIALADRIIIPIAPSQADVWSTQRFLKMISEHRQTNNAQVMGLLNRADTHRAVRETDEAAEAIQALDGIQLLDTRLYLRTTYRRSFSEGLAVFEMEPRSKAANEVDALGKDLYKN